MRQEVTPEAHPVEIGTNTQVEQMRLAGPVRDDAIADGLLARTQDPATVADTQTIPEYSRRPREFVAARLNGGNIIDVCRCHIPQQVGLGAAYGAHGTFPATDNAICMSCQTLRFSNGLRSK